jgi:glycerol-3-phosphate dehydrogenase
MIHIHPQNLATFRLTEHYAYRGDFMQSIETEVLVIGGGATGVGVVRDAAMRGFKTILVERRDWSNGTTGRYHGLLHSGGRYAVKDPDAARECIEENRILRRIMPHCIEDTGGFFVVTPWDDPAFGDRFMAGCQDTGIPCEEISVEQMLKEEPLLNPDILRCFRVPDGSADSFLASESNIASAVAYGAQVFNYHEVTRLLLEGNKVVGVVCHDLANNEDVTIHADIVVNAAGALVGKIAQTIGIEIHVVPGKGTMVAIANRVLNTVVNRCKMPADGDIIVPVHTVAVIGTTDVRVSDPDHFAIEPWEVQLMLDEGEKLVPGTKQMRILRAWAGVRPLYQETAAADTRDVTRAYTLLDHSRRDGIEGFITITGGKWTTYRQMAEVVVNRICEKLDTTRECRTALEALPDIEDEPRTPEGYYWLGSRLAHVEKEKEYGDLVCECELVTKAHLERSFTTGNAKTLDDIRRDTRLGMGPCQGGFCTYRAAGFLHEFRELEVEQTDVAVRDFLRERWKGLVPILWGSQLKQERLNELIYMTMFNADHLPGPQSSRLGPELYEKGTAVKRPETAKT